MAVARELRVAGPQLNQHEGLRELVAEPSVQRGGHGDGPDGRAEVLVPGKHLAQEPEGVRLEAEVPLPPGQGLGLLRGRQRPADVAQRDARRAEVQQRDAFAAREAGLPVQLEGLGGPARGLLVVLAQQALPRELVAGVRPLVQRSPAGLENAVVSVIATRIIIIIISSSSSSSSSSSIPYSLLLLL